MLANLPGIKTALFTRRIIMINQSIAPLGTFKNNINKPRGYLWYEVIQGRKDEDIASVIIKFLRESSYRDSKNFTMWCDNCSVQNKNWTLYSSIVHQMFQSETSLKLIMFKYFEKGHIFMSADSFYYQVEDKIRRKKYLYDFNDYVDCIDSVGKALLMRPNDFFDFKSYQSKAKDTNYPNLSQISEIQFRKGETKTFWKTSFGESYYQSGEFLKKNFCDHCLKEIPIKSKGHARGVNKKKKDDILKKLVEMMPKNSHSFWESLPENEASEDLSINYEHLSQHREW